jgi:hypothetical protein
MLDKLNQLKQFLKSSESEIVLFLGVILISLISFAAGRLSSPSLPKQPITIANQQAFVAENSTFKDSTPEKIIQEPGNKINSQYVASKNSNKYHLPDCPGARRIAANTGEIRTDATLST